MLNPGNPSLLLKQPVSEASGDFMGLVPGSHTSAQSLPVVIASDQGPIAITGSISATNPSVAATAGLVPTSATYLGGNQSGNLVGVLLDASGYLKVNVAAGSGGNGAASNTGSGVPAQADYVGLNVSGNLRGQTGVNPTGSVYSAQTDLTSVGGLSFALGQQLAAAAIPVVLTAAQITTLTPVSAVTATLNTETTKTIGVTRTADGSGTLITSTSQALNVNISSGTVTTHPVTVVSGGIASGAIAAGAIASGAAVAGAFADGAQTTLGLKADAKSVATDTTSVTVMQVLKEISFMLQTPAALAAGSALIGKVGVDQTTPGTTNGVSLVPTTTGGYTPFHLVSAGSTNATNVKAAAGQLFGWYIYNSNAAARKVAFHNTAGTPTAGTAVVFSVVIPPGAAANVLDGTGIAFATGIAITTVTGLADSDGTAVAANDLIINLFYK